MKTDFRELTKKGAVGWVIGYKDYPPLSGHWCDVWVNEEGDFSCKTEDEAWVEFMSIVPRYKDK